MEVTILGSGSPLPQTSRAGQSIVVAVDGKPILFDCGPMAVKRLLENGFELQDLTNLFITHHHMDHNASFFHFAITSWMDGRHDLTVYGPDGTDSLLDALDDVYEADIGSREKFGRPIEGIAEITSVQLSELSRVSEDDWTVTAHSVDHSILTYAYRIETNDGKSVVYAPDTSKTESLSEFATDVDVLIHDAAVGPEREATPEDPEADRESWRQFQATNRNPDDTPIVDVHSSAREAAEIAEAANAETLVLTHFLPFRDVQAMRSEAAETFTGDVRLAEDGLTISVWNAPLHISCQPLICRGVLRRNRAPVSVIKYERCARDGSAFWSGETCPTVGINVRFPHSRSSEIIGIRREKEHTRVTA